MSFSKSKHANLGRGNEQNWLIYAYFTCLTLILCGFRRNPIDFDVFLRVTPFTENPYTMLLSNEKSNIDERGIDLFRDSVLHVA